MTFSRSSNILQKMTRGTMGGESRVATPPTWDAPATPGGGGGSDCTLRAGRLWPIDCETPGWYLPKVENRGADAHIVPFPNFAYGPQTYEDGQYHYVPCCVMLDAEYGVYVADQMLEGGAPSLYDYQRIAFAFRRTGMEIEIGDPLILEPNGTTFYGDLPSDAWEVNSTHAITSYGIETAGGAELNIVVRLLKRTGMDLEIVDTHTSTVDQHFGDPWTDITRIPQSDRFVCTTNYSLSNIEVSGDSMTVVEVDYTEPTGLTGDDAIIYDSKVAALDADGRFILGGYADTFGVDYGFFSARLNGDLSVTWGEAVEWTEDGIHLNAFGSTDPLLARLGLQSTAVICYRAGPAGDSDTYGCTADTPNKQEHVRAQRIDVAEDLSIFQWGYSVIDAQPNSSNTAPMAIRANDEGTVFVLYDTVQPYDLATHEIAACARLQLSDLEQGIEGSVIDTRTIPGQTFWGIDVAPIPGSPNLCVVATTQGTYVTPEGRAVSTWWATPPEELMSPSDPRQNDFPPEDGVYHNGTTMAVVDLGPICTLP